MTCIAIDLDSETEAEASTNMLAAAALFTMTRFAEAPSPEAAEAVIQHLEILAEDERADPLIREVCCALLDRWQGNQSECMHRGAANFCDAVQH